MKSSRTNLQLRPNSQTAGFTLLELLAVISIIVILAGLTLGTLGYVNRKGAESRARAEVAAVSSAIESFNRDVGRYPEADDLVDELTRNTGKVYFEVLPRHTNASGRMIDPWGDAYIYATNPASIQNRGFFDFYSRGGGQEDASKWIRN
jgi:general secretion pathway protein G